MLNVLILDDVPDNVDVIEMLLEEYCEDNEIDYDIDAFTSPTAAYEYMCGNTTKDYDLVFLDIMMPEIDGLEFLKLIRFELSMKQPYIIMETALSNDDIRTEEFEFGANAFLIKPINAEIFRSIVDTFYSAYKNGEKYVEYKNINEYIKTNTVLLD